MSVNRPYHRTCRQFVDGQYTEGGRWEYIMHPSYSQSPEHYIRAFLLLLKDIRDLFDYVEPSDQNLSCYSYRIHSLLLRSCIEVEANCKAILEENGYNKKGDWNMEDYKKIEKTHFLSAYEVKVPAWQGTREIWKPFSAWSSSNPLPWYQVYNATKHDRHNQFKKATFEQLINASCGLLVILSAQFETRDFSTNDFLLSVGDFNDGMKSGIGGFFRVKFPENWPSELRYNFEWNKLSKEVDPFQKIDYSKII